MYHHVNHNSKLPRVPVLKSSPLCLEVTPSSANVRSKDVQSENIRSKTVRWLRPIPEDLITWHLTLFVVLATTGAALKAAEHLPLHKRGDVVGFTNTMIDGSGSVILLSATISTVIVEGTMIFAERYLKHRFEKGREEGVERGVELERQRWLDWFARKQAAEDAGQPFDEPMPGQTANSNGKAR